MKLPEPIEWAMKRKDLLFLDVITPEEHDSYSGKYTVPLYTADQLKQAIRDALEEAAKEVDFEAMPSERPRFGVASDTIRAMIKDIK